MTLASAQGSPRAAFAVVAVAVSAYTLVQSTTVPALPRMQQQLDTDQSTIAWVLTAFLLSASVSTPIVGRLGDSFGKRRMLVACLGALCVGSLIAAVAPSIGIMIAARVVQGASSGLIPLSFGIVRDVLEPARVPGAISVVSSLLAVGFGVGIVLSGPIIHWFGFSALFLLPALVSGLAGVAARVLLHETKERSFERISVLPALMLAGWLSTLLLALTKGPQWGWLSASCVALFGVAVALFNCWLLAERRATVPVIHLPMLAAPGVWTANLVALLIGAALYGSMGFLPQFSQTPTRYGYGFGADITEAGRMILPTSAASFVSGFLSARIARRLGHRLPMAVGCLLTSVGLLTVAFYNEEKWTLYLAATLIGCGCGYAFAGLANLVVIAVPPSQTGVATGMNANLRTVGGSFGVAVMTTVVGASMLPSGYPLEVSYTQGFTILAILALVASGLALFIEDRPSGWARGPTRDAQP